MELRLDYKNDKIPVRPIALTRDLESNGYQILDLRGCPKRHSRSWHERVPRRSKRNQGSPHCIASRPCDRRAAEGVVDRMP
jgi:hypothetical protein